MGKGKCDLCGGRGVERVMTGEGPGAEFHDRPCRQCETKADAPKCEGCAAGDTSSDPVHHPDHYCRGGMEARDVIAAMMPPGLTPYQGWCWGNAMKYLLRLGCKGPAAEDLAKAGVYLDWLGASLAE